MNHSTAHRRGHDVIVIGGSLGSLPPLRRILSDLPADLPASIAVVVHLAQRVQAPIETLAAATQLKVCVAKDGFELRRGVVYVAPADRHLILAGNGMRLVRGPRENNARPAVDTLFRSAAVTFRGHVAGIVLSGRLSDGAAGLAAVKRCGGVAIVQHPADAYCSDMPVNALGAADVDYSIPASEIGATLRQVVDLEPPSFPGVPEDLQAETRLALRAMTSTHVLAEGEPTPLTCPECQGPLWRKVVPGGGLQTYRCEVGHAFTDEALLGSQTGAVERALWVAFRTLKERVQLLEKMAGDARARGFRVGAENYASRINELNEHLLAIQRVIYGQGADAPPTAVWEVAKNAGTNSSIAEGSELLEDAETDCLRTADE